MCRHILNAQVSVRAPCCKRWFDCPQCHEEAATGHKLLKVHEIVLACKHCKKVFRKDSRVDNEESDEYCPYCDNHYVLAAEEPASADNSQNIEFAELLQQQLLQFNDPRMKTKFANFDEELEALLNE